MDIHFGCTMCGKCCEGLRVPLSLGEAIEWIERGHAVDVLCEAMPWAMEPAEGDEAARYKRDRSFPAMCGALPVRIIVIVTTSHSGPCPNRLPDLRCGIYDERPMVCRIYPTELNPTVTLDVGQKRCPSDAWAPSFPVLQRDGQSTDGELRDLIVRARATAVADAAVKAGLCAALGIRSAALSNEGYVIHRPDPSALLDGLKAALRQQGEGQGDQASSDAWTMVTNRKATLDTLAWMGAQGELAQSGPVASGRDENADYLGFYSDAL